MIMLSNLTVMPKHGFMVMTIQLMTLYFDITLKKSCACKKIIIGLVVSTHWEDIAPRHNSQILWYILSTQTH